MHSTFSIQKVEAKNMADFTVADATGWELLHVTPDYNVSRAFGFILGLGLDWLDSCLGEMLELIKKIMIID